MPITKRQFELRIDDDIENRMRQIYELLINNRDLAYSVEELHKAFLGETYHVQQRKKLERALEVLGEIGAAEVRIVDDTEYFAFRQEFDTSSWEVSGIAV